MVQPTSGAIRAANRSRIVDVLRRSGAVTRAELVDRTGLSRATVSGLVGDLTDQGLLSETRFPGGGRGRPPTLLSLNRSAGLAVAIDVGVRHVAVAVGDLSRSVLAERWTALPRGHRADEGFGIVTASIDETLREAGVRGDQLVGAAVSIAAPIAPESGRLLVPGVLPGWNGTELAARVGAHLGVPVAVDNDANLGALGEAVSRRTTGDAGLVYVKVASRVGVGIVLGSRVHRGRDGYAGEFGHVTVDPHGPLCWCGRQGCLELYAGGDGMLERLRERGVGCTAVADVEALLEAARRDDPVVRDVVDDGARILARRLADLSLVLAPSAVVLGGELTALGARLVEPVRAALAAAPFGTPPEVVVSELNERASLVGALALVLSESAHFVDRSQHPAHRPARRRDVTSVAGAPLVATR